MEELYKKIMACGKGSYLCTVQDRNWGEAVKGRVLKIDHKKKKKN